MNEQYQVTARKWRPKKFEDVVGQEHITSTLKNAIKSGRIAHAYIFTGPRGVGKTTTARILAKVLNCENPKNFEPCDECPMCQSINSSQTMDIIEIDGASNRGIDEIRTLRESVKYAPTRGKYKIYIIDEVHMLTKESFNAFLKTLEEPPAHTIFVFATTDIHKVPLTIISRCQRFDFRRIQLDTIKKTLSDIAEKENISIDDKTLTLIAKKADGALRDAQSLFDQVRSFCGENIDSETVSKMLNLIDEDLFFNISDAVIDKNFNIVFQTTDQIYQNGWDFIDFTDGLLEHFRNILTTVLTEKTELIETADVYRARYANYIKVFSKGDLLRILNYLSKLQQELRYSNNQKLKIEIALTNLVALEKSATLSEIISGLESGSLTAKETLDYTTKDNSYKYFNSTQSSVEKKSPVVKDEPPVKNTFVRPINETLSANKNELNFETITKKWQQFVDEVCKDRTLTLTHIFNNIKPIFYDGTNLHIDSSDRSIIASINLHQEHIDKKSREFFGKKLSFKYTQNEINENISASKEVKNPKKSAKSSNITDQYEKIIIEELGGQEIV